MRHLFAILVLGFGSVVSAQIPSFVQLSAAPAASSTLGQPVAFTATVSATATGQVDFYDLGVPIGRAVLDGGSPSTAVFTTANLQPGPNHSITAFYEGASPFDPNFSNVLPFTVNPRPTTLTLGAPLPSTVPVGTQAVITATVTDAATTGPPGVPGSFNALTGTLSHLHTGRSGFTATLLLNNQYILITGGKDSAGNVLDTVEYFDTTTSSFIVMGHLNVARTGHTATLLSDGTVLLIGGTGTGGTLLNSAETYNPLTGLFTPVTGTIGLARTGHTATLIPCSLPPCSSPVLITGGTTTGGAVLNNAVLYAGGSFSAVMNGQMSYPRTGHAATLLEDGASLLITGGDVSGSAELITYNSATDTISSLGPATWTTSRSHHTATLLPDGNVLIAGGQRAGTAVNTVELYPVPASLTSFPATFATISPTVGMTTPRSGHIAVLLASGVVAFVGGLDAAPATLDTAEGYTPSYDPLGLVNIASDDVSDYLNQCTLAASGTGTTTCNVSVKPAEVGAAIHQLTVTYSGDTNHVAPAAGTTNVTVQKGSPVFSGFSISQTIFYGTPSITLSGKIGSAAGAPPVGQHVSISLNGNSQNASITDLSGSFSSTFDTRFIPASSVPYTITYQYAGDGNFNLASDASTSLTVLRAPLTVTADNKAKIYGQDDPPLTATITGFVNGETNAVVTGTPGFSVAGIAGIARVAGNYTITATIGTLVSANYSFASFSAGALSVAAAGTTTKVPFTLKNTGNGATFQFVGTAYPQFAGIPTGRLIFRDGTTDLATMVLPAGANSVTFTTQPGQLNAGVHTITAVYDPQGDPNFNDLTTAVPVSLTIGAPISTTASAPIQPVSLNISNPAGGTVNLTNGNCTVLAADNTNAPSLTCSVTPTTIAVASTAVPISVKITTGATTLARTASLMFWGMGLVLPGIVIVSLSARRQRRKVTIGIAIIVLTALALAGVGCGGTPSSVVSTPTVISGNYTVAVTYKDAQQSSVVVAAIPLEVK